MLAGTALVAAPYVKTASSAGRLALGLWDHWVPGANGVLDEIARAWGKANGVEVQIDFVSSRGAQDLQIGQAEASAKEGHDILVQRTWQVAVHRESLEPVDDVVSELRSRHGPYVGAAGFLARHDRVWRAVPAPVGSHTYPMVSRLDLFENHAGIDLTEMFPAGPNRDPSKIHAWNHDAFLGAAQRLDKAGRPFGNPIGRTSDSQDWLGPLFASFGAVMVERDGAIAAESDETRAALDYMKQLTRFMPGAVYGWDNDANNRHIVSGRGAAIQNPPSAWAVAKRDNPAVAGRLWHHDTPRGPAGRFRGSVPHFWGIWRFARNKQAAKDLMVHLAERRNIARLLEASQGYDMPMAPSYYDNKVWERAGPPAGALYNYPVRGDERTMVTGYPAPPLVAARIYNEGLIPALVAKVTRDGEAIDDAIAWAVKELEGYLRG